MSSAAPPSSYGRIAHVYDRLHRFKDYAAESAYVVRCIQARMPAARTLLDVACGTGNHIPGLSAHYEVEGLDLDERMLEQARAKFPALRLHAGSMTGFELGRRYDVVCCLFHSIAWARTVAGLADALQAMARHLAPGGLVLIEPFFTPDSFWTGYVKVHESREPDLTVLWMYASARQGEFGVFHNHYLIGGPEGIEHHAEDHLVGLFTRADFERAFADAGLVLEHDPVGPTGQGLYIGRRPADGHA